MIDNPHPYCTARWCEEAHEPNSRCPKFGNENIVQCGTCGRTWDDSVSTDVTPVPAGRCPFEYEHGEGE